MKKIFLFLLGILFLSVFIFIGIRGLKFVYNKYMQKINTITLKKEPSGNGVKIIFFHHSTGKCIWKEGVPQWFKSYNKKNHKNYQMVEQSFPKHLTSGYGWNNYPYDYWNIWVNNGGLEAYKNEPTLEMITEKYDIIIWKHCFPVSDILKNIGNPDISSDAKRIENYKLQYRALKSKMNQFINNKFIVWTGAARVKGASNEESASLAQSFFNWVRDEWDQPDDNIFLWDFYTLETEGDLYLKDEYAKSKKDSHPNIAFSKKVAPLFCQRIVDIIEGRGDQVNITGK